MKIFKTGLPHFQKKNCSFPISHLYMSRCGVEGLNKTASLLSERKRERGRKKRHRDTQRETERETDRETDTERGIEMGYYGLYS